MTPLSSQIQKRWRGFLRNDEGATTIEYALIAAAMCSALVTAFNMLLEGGGLLAGIDDILNPAPPPPPADPQPP